MGSCTRASLHFALALGIAACGEPQSSERDGSVEQDSARADADAQLLDGSDGEVDGDPGDGAVSEDPLDGEAADDADIPPHEEPPCPYVVYRATITGVDALWATRADQPGTAHRLSPPSEEGHTPIVRIREVPGKAVLFDTLDTTYITHLADLTTRPLIGENIRAETLVVAPGGTHVAAQLASSGWQMGGEAYLVDIRTPEPSATSLPARSLDADAFTPDGTGFLERGEDGFGLTFVDLTTHARTPLAPWSSVDRLSLWHTPQGRFVVFKTGVSPFWSFFVFDRTQPETLHPVEVIGFSSHHVVGATSTQLHLQAFSSEGGEAWLTLALPDGAPIVRESSGGPLFFCGDRILRANGDRTTLFDDREPNASVELPGGSRWTEDCDHVRTSDEEPSVRELVSPLALGASFHVRGQISPSFRYSYYHNGNAQNVVVYSTKTGTAVFEGMNIHGDFGAFTPDDEQFFYARKTPDGPVEIVSVTLDGDTPVTDPPKVEAIADPVEVPPHQYPSGPNNHPGAGRWWHLSSDGETLIFPAAPRLGEESPFGMIALRRANDERVQLTEPSTITHLKVLGSAPTGEVTFTMNDRYGFPRPYTVLARSGALAVPQIPDAPHVREVRLSRDGLALLAWNDDAFWIDRVQTEANAEPPVLGPVQVELSDALAGMGPYGFLLRTADDAETWSRVDTQGVLHALPAELSGPPRWLADGRAVFVNHESAPTQLFVPPVDAQNAPAPASTVSLPEGTTEVLGVAPETARAWIRRGGAQAGVYAMPLLPTQPEMIKLSAAADAQVWISHGGESAAALSAGRLTVLRAGDREPIEVSDLSITTSTAGAALSDDGNAFMYYSAWGACDDELTALNPSAASTRIQFQIPKDYCEVQPSARFGSLQFSPDGKYALHVRNGQAQLLDLVHGTLTELDSSYVQFDLTGRYLISGLRIGPLEDPAKMVPFLPAGGIVHIELPSSAPAIHWAR